LHLLEARENPATGLTPDMVHAAEGLAEFFYTGTQAALLDQSFIQQAANRAPTQAVAGIIVQQAVALEDVLSRYVVELQEEKAAAAPVYAGWYDGLIVHFAGEADHARLAGSQAQFVSGLIDQFNAADAARAAAASQTTGTGTTTTGVGTAGLGTVGTTGTGTVGTTGTSGATTGTTGTTGTTTGTTGTTTGTTDTSGSSGTGTTGSTTGTPSGVDTGAGSTTGSSPTGTTPTQTSGITSGNP
jgi:hypothetical protein